MKAAAAVLAGSLLFFLGVVTGVGRRESLPPPAPIPLGVVDPSAPSNALPAPPGSGDPGDGGPSTTTSPAPASTTSRPNSSRPPGSPESSGPAGAPTQTTGTTGITGPAATTATTRPSTTSTTAAPRPVEEVDNQVDCTSPGKRGKGKREPCPPTTTTTGAG